MFISFGFSRMAIKIYGLRRFLVHPVSFSVSFPVSLKPRTGVSVIICVRNVYDLYFRKSVILTSYVFNLVIERIQLSFTELTDFSGVTRIKYRSEDQTDLSSFQSHPPPTPSVKVSHPYRHADFPLPFPTT